MSGLSTGGLTGGGGDVDAAAVLKLLAKPDEMQASIAAYVAAKAEAEAAIALAGKAKQIPKLLADAEKKQLDASEVLSAAQTKSENILAAARNEAADISSAAAEIARNHRAEADKAIAEVADAKKTAASIVAAAKKDAAEIIRAAKQTLAAAEVKNAEIIEQLAAAKTAREAADTARDKYETLTATLRGVMAAT